MVLAFSSIEEIGQDQVWSETQKQLIERLAVTATKSDEFSESERNEVANASSRREVSRRGLRLATTSTA